MAEAMNSLDKGETIKKKKKKEAMELKKGVPVYEELC
jgi:hypothetical protein